MDCSLCFYIHIIVKKIDSTYINIQISDSLITWATELPTNYKPPRITKSLHSLINLLTP